MRGLLLQIVALVLGIPGLTGFLIVELAPLLTRERSVDELARSRWQMWCCGKLTVGMLRLYSTLAKNPEGGGRILFNKRPRHECAQNVLVFPSRDSQLKHKSNCVNYNSKLKTCPSGYFHPTSSTSSSSAFRHVLPRFYKLGIA